MTTTPSAMEEPRDWGNCWRLSPETIYLNHGSFGPPPEPVRQARREWIDRLDAQPMEFFVRRLEGELTAARDRQAEFVGTRGENLVFVDNATYAMNIVAGSVRLSPRDNVVLTSHEYGAVRRIWERACEEAGARSPRIAPLVLPIESAEQVVEAIFARVNAKTRLLVVSHVTSPTAVILPVGAICEEARRLGVPVCIDGPHAIAHLPLDIDGLDCDFYTASCHKWLSAPFGSGFLYVHPRRQPDVRPAILSWGRLPPAERPHWCDEFMWLGTRDPSALLSVPAAIDFLIGVGLETFRRETHALARRALERLCAVSGLAPVTPGGREWFGSMALAPLPPGDSRALQTALWEQFSIEVPVVEFEGRRFLRVSCHLYNHAEQIEILAEALATLLRQRR